MGAWEKLQLGWLDYKTSRTARTRTSSWARPTCDSAKGRRPCVVTLPERTVVTDHNTPHSGAGEWWSGCGNDLNNDHDPRVDLTGATAASSAPASGYNIEVGLRHPARRGVDRQRRQLDRRSARPVDGRRGTWTAEVLGPSAYTGKYVQFRFRFAPTAAWPARPSSTTSPSPSTAPRRPTTSRPAPARGPPRVASDHQRHHLAHGAGHVPRREPHLQRLRRHPARPGRTTSAGPTPSPTGWSGSRTRTACSSGSPTVSSATTTPARHPGGGQVLPVDARPGADHASPDGVLLGNRRQPFDATFGQEKTDAVTFHRNGVPTDGAVAAPASRRSTTRTSTATGPRRTRGPPPRWPVRAPA